MAQESNLVIMSVLWNWMRVGCVECVVWNVEKFHTFSVASRVELKVV